MNSRTMTIGRAPDNDLVAGDRHVSSHHARLLREGSSIIIEDLQSTNHTYVDGVEVTRKSVSVGDLIQFSFYYEFDWNHPIVRQWLSTGSGASAGVPAVVTHGIPVERVSAPAAQWKGPDDDYCPSCGSVVRRGVKFCSGCGAQVDGSFSSRSIKHPVVSEVKQEQRTKGIPERCPHCNSTNIRKLSVHNESKKSGGGGCNSCLLLVIIAILAPGLILILGVGGALGLAGVTYFISENLEIVIPVAVALLIISILVSVNNSKTYVCGKCGMRFK